MQIDKNKFDDNIINNRGFGLELEFAFKGSENEDLSWPERRAIKKEALKKACDLAEEYPHIFRGLRIVHDGSTNVAIEIVFPILFDHSYSWEYIENILQVLKDNNFYVASENGMHVHISTHKALEIGKFELSDKSISHQESLIRRSLDNNNYDTIDFSNGFIAPSNTFKENTQMEFELVRDIMLRYSLGLDHIQKFLPSSRSNNNFCYTHNMTESRINSANSIANITFGKFTAINLEPFINGTIEFRQALTTLNVNKIIVWIRFLNNLIRYSDEKRLNRISENTFNAPNSLRPYLFRSNTRQELLYSELYNSTNSIGIQTSELMNTFGLTSQSIRRLISDIHNTFRRNQINSDDFLITHTFRENGSSYGDGIENTSYQIVREVNRSSSCELLPANRIGMESVFAELDDETFAYLHQAKTNRLMRI